MRFQLIVCFTALNFALTGQISFSEVETNMTENFKSGAAVVTLDMNGDTQDDLVRLDKGVDVQVDLLHGNADFFMSYRNNIAFNPEWNLLAADMNNDGWPDIVTSGIKDNVKILQAIPFSNDYQVTTIDDQLFFAQASSVADANDDGFLDIFVCNDDALNRLYVNDGTGQFVRNDSIIDFRTKPASDNSGNYGSLWTDFDMDGDLDLYISKCRIGVTEFTDPRRINVLFVNTDTGFVEMADSFGLAIGAQSWSSDFGDIDNDGDLDVIVINHGTPSILFENKGDGVYEDITTVAGINIVGVTIQSIFRDFDNDGLIDLLVSGSRSKLYRNLGGNTFEEIEAPFGSENVTSFTIGDFNQDGFPDVYCTYNDLYNTPSAFDDDKVWLNDRNDNNYVRIKAIGTEGSSSAIGAKLFLHGAWGIQMREIRAGESYGIATSLIQNFGLGSAKSVDSLVVIWPGGKREAYSNVQVNRTMTVVEGSCLRAVVSLEQGPFVQCAADTFTINGPDGFDTYLWSNGMNTQSIDVTETGLYNVTMLEPGGCKTVTTSVALKKKPEIGGEKIVVDGRSELCYGQTTILTAPMGIAYLWSTGDTTEVIHAAETGIYSVAVTRACDEVLPDAVTITVNNPNNLVIENDTILGSGQGLLRAEGDSVSWYENIDDLIPVASGNTFSTPTVDSTTTYYTEQSIAIPGLAYATGMKEHLGGTKYHPDGFNVGLIFDALGDFRLDSVMTNTDFAGKRTIHLLNSEGIALDSKTMQIDSGLHWIPLGFDISVGADYTLSTDADTNNLVFGVVSPKLARSEVFVSYPYTVDGIVSIKDSEFGGQFYYYFYDWRITGATEYCKSDKKAVSVIVTDTSTNLILLNSGTIRAYPNPTSDWLNIDLDNPSEFGTDVKYSIKSLDGREVKSGPWSPGQQISMRGLAGGIYSVELASQGVLAVVRVVVLNGG